MRFEQKWFLLSLGQPACLSSCRTVPVMLFSHKGWEGGDKCILHEDYGALGCPFYMLVLLSSVEWVLQLLCVRQMYCAKRQSKLYDTLVLLVFDWGKTPYWPPGFGPCFFSVWLQLYEGLLSFHLFFSHIQTIEDIRGSPFGQNVLGMCSACFFEGYLL